MSYEIELKAHVYNRENAIEKLNTFATFTGSTCKKDTYYHFFSDENHYKSARLRKEVSKKDNIIEEKNYFTYKKKKNIKNPDGTNIEVNEENECTVSDLSPLETFFNDINGIVSLKKEKDVMGWNFCKDGFILHIELCKVSPLGDFLEIEVINDNNEKDNVEKIKMLEVSVLEKCGISKDQIEPRYYSDLLKEVSENQ